MILVLYNYMYLLVVTSKYTRGWTLRSEFGRSGPRLICRKLFKSWNHASLRSRLLTK